MYALNTNSAGTNTLLTGSPKTVTVTADTQAPTVSNVSVTNISATGYTVSCTVTDNAGVARVEFPTWTAANDQDDIVWGVGTKSGNTFSYNVTTKDHTYQAGCTYITNIHAYDTAGNMTNITQENYSQLMFAVPAPISNVVVSDVDSTGYTVSCDLDNSWGDGGITRVSFPSWTQVNGNDDVVWHAGTISNGRATCRISVSEHGNAIGAYLTHIYVYDKSGHSSATNQSVWPCLLISVPSSITYTITYNANGGSGAPSNQTKTHGTALTLSSTVPTRTGYTFQGWATSSTATTAAYQPGGSYTNNASVTLYAVWEKNAEETGSGTWKHDSKGWWYQYSDGTYPADCWVKIDGVQYHFNPAGYMQTGWIQVNGSWYYLYDSGAMTTGWVKVSGTWYYMDAAGIMQTGWQYINGAWYYFYSSGAMVTGWKQIGTKWYYFYSSGAMATGWVRDSGSWYYMDTSGAMVTGWKWIGTECYYFYANGKMATNTYIGSYYVNARGAWVS